VLRECCAVAAAQAWRVLRPGGLLLVAFGSHCFSEKALAGWTTRSMQQRSELVTRCGGHRILKVFATPLQCRR
jgi:hypothetical protein